MFINNRFRPYKYSGVCSADDKNKAIHNKINECLIQNINIVLNKDIQVQRFHDITKDRTTFNGEDLIGSIIWNTRFHIKELSNPDNRNVIVSINTRSLRTEIFDKLDGYTLSRCRKRDAQNDPEIPFLSELVNPRRNVRLAFCHNANKNKVSHIKNQSSGESRKVGWLEKKILEAIEMTDNNIWFCLEGEEDEK